MKYTLLILILLSIIGCSQKITGDYSFKTECFGSELDGSQTVKSWGYGRNWIDAVSQAKKEALNDVIFNGIRDGKVGCSTIPIITEINARKKYSSFFNSFFSDKGSFDKFVNTKDERVWRTINRDKYKTREGVIRGVLLRVESSKLREYLIKNEIISQN